MQHCITGAKEKLQEKDDSCCHSISQPVSSWWNCLGVLLTLRANNPNLLEYEVLNEGLGS